MVLTGANGLLGSKGSRNAEGEMCQGCRVVRKIKYEKAAFCPVWF